MGKSIIAASRLDRFAAKFVDFALLFLIPLTGWGIDSLSVEHGKYEFFWIGAIIAFLTAQVVLLSISGQTIGKKIMKIRIVLRNDLGEGGFVTTVLARGFINLLAITIIVPIIDHLFIFGKTRRCLHDRIADTIVIPADIAMVNNELRIPPQSDRKTPGSVTRATITATSVSIGLSAIVQLFIALAAGIVLAIQGAKLDIPVLIKISSAGTFALSLFFFCAGGYVFAQRIQRADYLLACIPAAISTAYAFCGMFLQIQLPLRPLEIATGIGCFSMVLLGCYVSTQRDYFIRIIKRQ
jgi:uncharacterized RDD family membrane protein YckC